MPEIHYRLKSSLAANRKLRKENKQLRRELEMALESLKWSRDKLVEAQFELSRMRWVLVSTTEGGKDLVADSRRSDC